MQGDIVLDRFSLPAAISRLSDLAGRQFCQAATSNHAASASGSKRYLVLIWIHSRQGATVQVPRRWMTCACEL